MSVLQLESAVCDYCALEHAGECVRAKITLFRRDETAVEVIDFEMPDLNSSGFPDREPGASPHLAVDAGPHR